MTTQRAKMSKTIAIDGTKQLAASMFGERFKMKPKARIKATDKDTEMFTRFDDFRSHSADTGQNIFLKILTS